MLTTRVSPRSKYSNSSIDSEIALWDKRERRQGAIVAPRLRVGLGVVGYLHFRVVMVQPGAGTRSV